MPGRYCLRSSPKSKSFCETSDSSIGTQSIAQATAAAQEITLGKTISEWMELRESVWAGLHAGSKRLNKRGRRAYDKSVQRQPAGRQRRQVRPPDQSAGAAGSRSGGELRSGPSWRSLIFTRLQAPRLQIRQAITRAISQTDTTVRCPSMHEKLSKVRTYSREFLAAMHADHLNLASLRSALHWIS